MKTMKMIIVKTRWKRVVKEMIRNGKLHSMKKETNSFQETKMVY